MFSIKGIHDYMELKGGDTLLADGSKTWKSIVMNQTVLLKKETTEP